MTEARKKSIGRNMTEGPILKTLLTFAIPIVLANLIQQVYGMVDLMIAGQYVGSIGTAGVSNGGEMADLLLPVATALSSAGQIYIAQLVGAKKDQDVKEAVGTLLTVMLFISCIFTTVVAVFHRQILQMINCPIEAMGQASDYMVITAFGLPFIFFYNAICGVLRGLGESKRPLIFVIVAAVANIIADVFFVVVLRMEAAGTAIATVISQIGACAAAFIYLYKRREQFDFTLRLTYFRISKKPLLVIVKLGIPQLTKSILVHFSMLWVNVNINGYGLVASSTNGIGNKIQKLLNIFINSVENAASAMIAQNLGARKTDRAGKITLYTFGSTLVMAILTSLLILVFPRQLYGMFTPDQNVISLGTIYLQILVIHLFMMSFTGSFQALVTGSGFVTLTFILGIMDGVVCRVGFSLLFLHVFDMGLISFFWGTALSRTIPGLICLGYFLSGKWKTRRLLTEDRKKAAKV